TPAHVPRVNEANREIVNAFRRSSDCRPSSASGAEDHRQAPSVLTQRPNTAPRDSRAPSSGGRLGRLPRLGPPGCPQCGLGRPLPRGLVLRGGRAGPPFRPPTRPDGVKLIPGRTMPPRPGMPRRGGRGGLMPPRPGMAMGKGPRGPRGPRGPMPPRGPMRPRGAMGRGPRGPMRGGGRGRGRPDGRMMVGPRGARMGR
ncbi:unnamed protein product, partial [Ectocarpus sp. 13 AM-2016]